MMDDLLETCGLRRWSIHRSASTPVEGLTRPNPASSSAHDHAPDWGRQLCVRGEDAAERAVAVSVGFRVSPQPLHALHLVESEFALPTPLSTNHTSALEQ